MSDYNVDFGLDTPNSCILDQNKIEIANGARLKRIVSSIPDSLIEDFSSSAGFNFDPTKTAIDTVNGQLIQLDTRPAGATFYSKLNSVTDANWGNGSLGAISVKGGSIQNDRFEFSNTDIDNAIEYSPNSNVTADIGTIRLKFIPFYSGAPTDTQYLLWIGRQESTYGTIALYHLSNGRLNAYFVNTAHDQYRSMYFDFFPTAGQTYEIELDFDLVNGNQYIFLDGVLKNQKSYTMVIDPATLFLVGNARGYNSKSNFGISNILIYNAIQHTADYTPDWWNIYQTIFVEDIIAIPTQTNPHPGDISKFINFNLTENVELSYIINGLWFNGTNWEISDGTISETNTATEIQSNVETLPARNTLDVTVFTTSSNTQNTISNITTDYFYMIFPQDNPTMLTASPINTDEIDSLTAIMNATGTDNIKIAIRIDGQDKYYNTANSQWEDSIEYAETNDFSELTESVLQSLLTVGASVQLKLYLHNADGETTPELTKLSMGYSFHPGDPTKPKKCIVYGFLYNSNGQPISGQTVSAQLNAESIYADSILINDDVVILTITDSTGYWEMYLIENENMKSTDKKTLPAWKFSIDGQILYKKVPNQLTANFMTL